MIVTRSDNSILGWYLNTKNSRSLIFYKLFLCGSRIQFKRFWYAVLKEEGLGIKDSNMPHIGRVFSDDFV